MRKEQSIQEKFKYLIAEMNSIILGKEESIKLAICCILSKGHLLIEDLPGTGKTTLVKALASLCNLHFQRIQFTNDLLPADIIGVSIFNQTNQAFEFHKGPIFGELVLGDELNRATPKTQSAFLQAMEEQMVSVDGNNYALPTPFFFFATQNSFHQTGTFPLPESQIDRFFMRINLGWTDRKYELKIIQENPAEKKIEELKHIIEKQDISYAAQKVEQIQASSSITTYILDIIEKLRGKKYNISTRAAIAFLKAAKAWAFLHSRDYVIHEDVQQVAYPVLIHRMHTYEDIEKSKETLETVIAETPLGK